MTESDSYFVADTSSQGAGGGNWVTWSDLDPLEIIDGLRFQPVLGKGLMVNFVTFEPKTVAPVHWHDEEQISFVLDGELEFEVAGEKRIMKRGDAVVIPSNVPHGARTLDGTCLQVDAFHPPRRGLLDAIAAKAEGAGA